MKTLDPGHLYLLDTLDGDVQQVLRFVKRCNPPEKYPGNKDAYPGTNLQEVLRAMIDRLKYVDGQVHCHENITAIELLRQVLLQLEVRAAKAHGKRLTLEPSIVPIEFRPTCPMCGHLQCEH